MRTACAVELRKFKFKKTRGNHCARMNKYTSTTKKAAEKKATSPKGVWHGSRLSPAVIGGLFGRLEDIAERLDNFLAELEGYLPATPVHDVQEDGEGASSEEEVAKFLMQWNARLCT